MIRASCPSALSSRAQWWAPEPASIATVAEGALAKTSSSFSRLSVLRSTIFPCASTPQTAKEFLARSRPKRIMDLLTRCLEGLTNLHSGTSMPKSGEVHAIR